MKRVAPISFLLLLAASFALAQIGEIAPADNLVVEGIPKIPASLGQAVDRYTEFRTATLVSWHPVRREMLHQVRRHSANPRGEISRWGSHATDLLPRAGSGRFFSA